MYTHLELHLAAVPMAPKHHRAVKKINGKPGRRVSGSARFVTLPATERALIDELVRAYGNGKTTIVARGGDHGEPSWVVVQYVKHTGELGACEQFDVLYASAREQAVRRGILKSDEEKAWDQMHAEATAENGRHNRKIHLEVMCEALAQYIENAGRPEDKWPREREKLACAQRYLDQYREGRAL